jgi:hypothetical protein
LRTGIFPPLVHSFQNLSSLSNTIFLPGTLALMGVFSSLSAVRWHSTRLPTVCGVEACSSSAGSQKQQFH